MKNLHDPLDGYADYLDRDMDPALDSDTEDSSMGGSVESDMASSSRSSTDPLSSVIECDRSAFFYPYPEAPSPASFFHFFSEPPPSDSFLDQSPLFGSNFVLDLPLLCPRTQQEQTKRLTAANEQLSFIEPYDLEDLKGPKYLSQLFDLIDVKVFSRQIRTTFESHAHTIEVKSAPPKSNGNLRNLGYFQREGTFHRMFLQLDDLLRFEPSEANPFIIYGIRCSNHSEALMITLQREVAKLLAYTHWEAPSLEKILQVAALFFGHTSAEYELPWDLLETNRFTP